MDFPAIWSEQWEEKAQGRTTQEALLDLMQSAQRLAEVLRDGQVDADTKASINWALQPLATLR
ncbi:hypothetical protein A2110_01320 [Candidatus Jorgensenbacteria bacterium GWA1_54_12]|uniref:Uncharacterized protein n=1 Tax=Candidatus Jorgensenbacteria bacterium GWA1_54_12 TaxID=1798468 RepID=A0A1F6BKI6_9BACT|nr:MAG: hypothetical protein A2110_01320 [Candidatus Jorgensenbacteria bacterium GWA1_54_12]